MSLATSNQIYINGSYIADRNDLIKRLENLALLVNTFDTGLDDSNGASIANGTTIGYGWDLDQNSALSTIDALEAAGVVLSSQQKSVLNAYKSQSIISFTISSGTVTRVPSQSDLFDTWSNVTITDVQATQLLDAKLTTWESGLSAVLGTHDLPSSRERAALISLLYNLTDGNPVNIQNAMPATIGILQRTPLDRGEEIQQRLDAWFEIAFRSNSLSQPSTMLEGIQNRRLFEASTFGLFKNGDTPDLLDGGIESIRTIQFLDAKNTSNSLLTYLTNRNFTTQAAQDALDDIYFPAREHLINDFYSQHILGGTVSNVTVTIDQAFRDALLDAPDMSDKRDLILGESGNDTINSGGGDDVLYGGSGLDVLEGGNGNDYLVGGSEVDDYIFASSGYGADRIADTDGRLVIAGTAVGSDSQSQGGYALIVDNGDGTYAMTHLLENYTLRFDGSGANLIIEKGTDSITLENYSDGAFGLSLAPVRAVATGRFINIAINVLANQIIAVTLVEEEDLDVKATYFPNGNGGYTPLINHERDTFTYYGLEYYGLNTTTTTDGNLVIYSESYIETAEQDIVIGTSVIQSFDNEGNLVNTFDLLAWRGTWGYGPKFTFFELYSAEDGGIYFLGEGGDGQELVKLDNNFNITGDVIIDVSWNNIYDFHLIDLVKATENSFLEIQKTTVTDNIRPHETHTDTYSIQEFNYQGVAIGDPLYLGTFQWKEGFPQHMGTFDVKVEVLDDGSFLMLTTSNIQTYAEPVIRGQIIYSDGTRSHVIVFDGGFDHVMTHDSVIPLNNGAFVVKQLDYNTDSWFTQAYDNQGHKIGEKVYFEDVFEIYGNFNSNQLSIAPLPGVGYVAAWIKNLGSPWNHPSSDVTAYTKTIRVNTGLVSNDLDNSTLTEGGSGNDQIEGQDTNDEIYGYSGADTLTGGGGNDYLVGGLGNDNLNGGAGYDTYVVNLGDGVDTITDVGANLLIFQNITSSQISLSLGSLHLKVGSTSQEVILPGFNLFDPFNAAGITVFEFADGVLTLDDILNIGFSGTAGDDTLSGANNNDIFFGLDGDDTIYGLLGDDELSGGAGNDTLYGGDGDDLFLIEGAQGVDHIDGGDGFDEIRGSAGNDYISLSAFVGVERIDGLAGLNYIYGTSDNDILDFSGTELVGIARIYGSYGDDVIKGSAQADRLLGGSGNDFISGGAGDDEYIFAEEQGNEVLQDSSGNDLIVLGGDPSQWSSVTPDRVVVTKDITNRIILIEVLLPDSTQVFRTITIQLNSGSDESPIEEVMFSDNSTWTINDLINRTVSLIPINGTSGNDTINGSQVAENISGLGGNDTINGFGGNDQITGGTGNDTMDGGAGNDVFLVEGTSQGIDTFTGGDGIDEIRGSTGNDNFELGVFSGTSRVERINALAGINLIFGTYASNVLDFSTTELIGIASIDGGGGNDVITGSAQADVIYGKSEIDTLYGGGGNDVLIGGTSNDTLYGDDGDDVFLVEGTGQGIDTFTGGEGIDEIRGTSGDDDFALSVFNGTSRVERIDGLAGINRILGSVSANIFDFSATELVGITSISGGGGNDVITGSAQADVIYGNSEIDTLYGGGGNDVLIGGTSGDTLYGDDGDDVFLVEGTGQGIDTFTGGDGLDEIRGTSGNDDFELAVFNGTSRVERIDGLAGINRILGASNSNTFDFSATELVGISSIDGGGGNDVITGSAQADTIIGNVGNDTLHGGAGGDTYIFASGSGSDSIYESANLSDIDVIQMGAGIDKLELWFTKQANDLLIRQVGSSDRVTVKDWYLHNGSEIERIEANGFYIEDEDVEILATAMSAYTPPVGLSGVMTQEILNGLATSYNNAWQTI